MLGARREHAIRLQTAARHEVVHENADVGVVALEHDRRPMLNRARGVETGDETLRRRFLVARRPVDLTGREETRHALRLQRAIEFRRLDEVVLHRVRVPQHARVFEARQRVDNRVLHVARQTHRQSVDVDLVDVHAFRLEEDLVPFLVGEPHDLVLE